MSNSSDRAQPRDRAEVLDVKAVADLLTCSTRHVFRMARYGQMPPPIKLGSLARWRRAEIDKWLADGCPRVDGR